MNPPLTVKCSMTLSRCSDGNFHFAIEDEDAGVQFLRAFIVPAEFVKLITTSPCDFEAEFRGLDIIGTRREHKELVVPYVHAFTSDKKIATLKRQALAPFEVDGWQGTISHLNNMHRSHGQNAYRVIFSRNVPKESK